MTNTLYSSTKTLIELIKNKKPEIEIISQGFLRVTGTEDWATYQVVKELGDDEELITDGLDWSKGNANYFQLDRIQLITAQSLLTLIPQLFDAVENPSFAQEMTSEGIYPYMDKVLLTRYFVDGLWVESETLVIDDLINQINAYL